MQEKKASNDYRSCQKKTRLDENVQMLIEDLTRPEELPKNKDEVQNVIDRGQKLPFLPENHSKLYPPLPLGSKHCSLKLSKPDSLGYAILDAMVILPLQTDNNAAVGMIVEPIDSTCKTEIEGS